MTSSQLLVARLIATPVGLLMSLHRHSAQTTCHISQLPQEIIMLVFAHLDIYQLCRLARVCR